MTSDFLKNYENCENTVRKLFDSKLRLGILDALEEGPLRLADLRREVNANAPNTSTKAKELERMGLVTRIDGDYALTPYGRAVRAHAKETFEFYSSYEKFKDFWDGHHVEGVPHEFMSRMGELSESELLRCTKENPIATHETFVDHLKTIKKELVIMSPLFQKEWINVISDLMDKGVKMEFIFTDNILKMFAETAKELGKLDEFESHAEFYEVPETHSLPAFLSSDTFFCISLESLAAPGNYIDMKIHSEKPKPCKWGKEMYLHFKPKYKKVKLKDYL